MEMVLLIQDGGSTTGYTMISIFFPIIQPETLKQQSI